MQNFEEFDNGKSGRKNHKKTPKKHFFDDEQLDKFKMNKSFKQRKKELREEDNDWENWEEHYRK